MKKFIIGFGVLIFASSAAQAAEPTVKDLPFQKEIQLPSLHTRQEVRVELDNEVLRAVNERFGNFVIFDRQNTPIEYSVFFQDFSQVSDANVLEVSSSKLGEKEFISDNNVLSSFTFDERTDGRNASWVLLDLGKEMPLTRVETFISGNAKIRSISVEGGLTAETLQTIIAKRPMQQRLELTTEAIRFVKLSFWGVQVKIDDIRITTGPSGSVYFSTLPGKKWNILYGGNELDRIMYTERISSEKNNLPAAQLGRQTINAQFPIDIDNDRVDFAEDNCPFVSNRSQKDSDDDRIGDACDNASEVLNSRQEDVDRDGIGDVIDNCKLVSNPDQLDRDLDGWGDACDNAYANEPVDVASWIKVVGVAIALMMLLFGLWQGHRVSKLKK